MTAMRWLIDKLSLNLDLGEREAVLGDMEELGIPERRAVLDLIGLLLRRQAALWRSYKPWLALLAIVGPIGMELGRISSWIASGLSTQIWAYGRWGVPFYNGLSVKQEIETYLCNFLAMIVWSWISGYVLASLSGRTVWVNGVLFYSIWFLLSGIPSLLFLMLRQLFGGTTAEEYLKHSRFRG